MVAVGIKVDVKSSAFQVQETEDLVAVDPHLSLSVRQLAKHMVRKNDADVMMYCLNFAIIDSLMFYCTILLF